MRGGRPAETVPLCPPLQPSRQNPGSLRYRQWEAGSSLSRLGDLPQCPLAICRCGQMTMSGSGHAWPYLVISSPFSKTNITGPMSMAFASHILHYTPISNQQFPGASQVSTRKGRYQILMLGSRRLAGKRRRILAPNIQSSLICQSDTCHFT